MAMEIREATEDDLDGVLDVERRAFGRDDEAELTRALLRDPTAEPRLSLIAVEDGRAVGHVLFTAAALQTETAAIRAAILAPLAVVPEMQRKGVGQRLTIEGLARLPRLSVALVFVLGHPTYYPRFGFEPASRLGFDPPYPLPEESADAWMVLALQDGLLGTVEGRLRYADALMRPETWRE